MASPEFTAIPPAEPIPMMSAEHARDIGRRFKGWADYLGSVNLVAEATRAERQASWWLAYAVALAQTTKPGSGE